jgi:hypothetical protein
MARTLWYLWEVKVNGCGQEIKLKMITTSFSIQPKPRVPQKYKNHNKNTLFGERRK